MKNGIVLNYNLIWRSTDLTLFLFRLSFKLNIGYGSDENKSFDGTQEVKIYELEMICEMGQTTCGITDLGLLLARNDKKTMIINKLYSRGSDKDTNYIACGAWQGGKMTRNSR